MKFFDRKQNATQLIEKSKLCLVAALSCFAWLSMSTAEADFDKIYTGVSESADKPPKVKFDYRLTPAEKITSVKVTAGDDVLTPQIVRYVDQADAKTAVLILIDTSNPRRVKEVQQAGKLVSNLLSKADDKRHVIGIYPFHGELDEKFAPMGTSLDELKQKAENIQATGINTMLYGSVLKAITTLENTKADRKALVVVSDWKSEDNVMDTREFVATALKKLQSGKIVCHSIVLVEEDQSELDTAEKLAQETGGDFVKVTRQSMAVPSTFTEGFFGQLENGGTAMIDMAGHEGATKLAIAVDTEGGAKFEYVYNREAKVGNVTTPAPVPTEPSSTEPAEPDSTDEPDGSPEQADEDKSNASNSSIKKSGGVLQDLMEGKDIYGVPLWAILVAIAVMVLILIVIVVMLLRGKKDDEGFDTEFVSQDSSAEIPATEGNEATEGIIDAPPLPPEPEYPEQFELGNGVALCRTLPESGEEIVAKLAFGENASRGVYPISVNKTAVRIGRGSDNDLSLNNDSVSRHHAEILSKRDGSFSITDLDSGNGVFVNDQEITQSALKSGDRVEIGEVVFVFQIES